MAQVSRRYARAFADVVMARKIDVAAAVSTLEQFTEVVASSSDLRNVLDSPSVPRQQKLKLLDAVVARIGGQHEVRNFAAILMDKHRIGLLAEITALVKAELNERLRLAEAEVTSARELAPDERSALEKKLSGMSGKTVRATYTQDPALLGGVRIRIGSTIYDGSVKGQLQRVKLQIAAQ